MDLCWNRCSRFVLLPLLLLLLLLSAALSATSAAVSLSDTIFDSGDGASIGRNLLQAKTPCPINFEFKNYTIITSRCKGPQFPPKLCCQAFKDFACPYTQDLNDLTNDCSQTMFSYINLYGRYPVGLFSSECTDGKIGLDCPALQVDDSANGSKITNLSSLLVLISTNFLIFLLRWF